MALAGLAEMAKFETYTSSTAITAGTCMHALVTHTDHAQCTFSKFKLTQFFVFFFFNNGHFHLTRAYICLKWNILKPKSQKQIHTFNDSPYYECAGQETNYEFVFVFQFSYHCIFTEVFIIFVGGKTPYFVK